MFCPSQPQRCMPVIFRNDSFDDKTGYGLYFWNSWRARINELFNYLNPVNLDLLIDQKGVSIIHELFGHADPKGYMFLRDGDGTYRISPQLDQAFDEVARRQIDGRLWVPTVREFADYTLKIYGVKVV